MIQNTQNMYKTIIYENSVKLEEGLNFMKSEGYVPQFVNLAVSGQILVVYSKE